MNETPAVTERLAQWLCAERYENLPVEVRKKTVDVIFDAVGGMVACSLLPEVKAITEFVEQHGGQPSGQYGCTVIGHRQTTSVVNAAMANGGMAHGDECDSVHMATAGGHVAAGPVPAALAVGEWLDASGKDVVRAVALGYEIGGRLMTIFYRERDHIARRFYHTSVIASLSSAVTAGALLGLDPRSLQDAMGLATYQAAGPDNATRDPGHMGKTFQTAAANRNGVTAALLAPRLAKGGCRVRADILDGSLGLFDAYLGNPELGPELLHELGRYYSIIGVLYKRYPAGSPNQAILQGLFGLLEKNPLAPEEIERIEIQLWKPGIYTLTKARHASITGNIVVALAVVYGKLDFYRVHDPAGVDAPAVMEMQEKVHFIPREDWSTMENNRHAIVTIRTKAGKKLEEEVWSRPMTQPELEQKFDGLVTPRFGAQRTRELEALVQNIESAASVRPLMEKLRG